MSVLPLKLVEIDTADNISVKLLIELEKFVKNPELLLIYEYIYPFVFEVAANAVPVLLLVILLPILILRSMLKIVPL